MGWSFLREPAKHEPGLSRQGAFLTRIIHEHFCCNRRSASTTNLRPAGSPSDPHSTARVRIGSSRLRAPVSRRGLSISQRTVMNNAG